ncbi:MAG: hypothetical protein J2P38_09215, partial [Candidatus Dormibacteraeota bacterium]|nr:hypothetical protein [Candidatus Dormibacteraeota bacterium]
FLARCFVPLLRAAGDLRTALFLAAPASVFLHHTRDRFAVPGLPELYEAMGGSLEVSAGEADAGRLVDWLSSQQGSGQEEW